MIANILLTTSLMAAPPESESVPSHQTQSKHNVSTSSRRGWTFSATRGKGLTEPFRPRRARESRRWPSWPVCETGLN